MIRISGHIGVPDSFINAYPANSIQRKIIELFSTSNEIYEFDSIDQLKFELDLRINIIKAAKSLYQSGLSFKTFRNSFCNLDYWKRTDEGGFLLKNNINPSTAIYDIFKNGSKYGTECATAIVIIYYKALLDIFSEQLFNTLFSDIYLMNWTSLDKNLGINYYRNPPDFFPGDCRYFKNPDVNPLTPEWQGENVIDLGNGTYYGHGIGIKSAEMIIKILNRQRKIDATETAYLLSSATRLNAKHLSNQYNHFISE